MGRPPQQFGQEPHRVRRVGQGDQPHQVHRRDEEPGRDADRLIHVVHLVADPLLAGTRGLVHEEAHRDAHPEELGRFQAAGLGAGFVDDEVAVIHRLDAEVVEIEVGGGIEGVGEVNGRNLAQRFRSIDALLGADEEEIARTPGILPFASLRRASWPARITGCSRVEAAALAMSLSSITVSLNAMRLK